MKTKQFKQFKTLRELHEWVVKNRFDWTEDDRHEEWMLNFNSCVEVSAQEALIHVINGGEAYFWLEDVEEDGELIPDQWYPFTFRSLACNEWGFEDFIAPSHTFGILPTEILHGVKTLRA